MPPIAGSSSCGRLKRALRRRACGARCALGGEGQMDADRREPLHARRRPAPCRHGVAQGRQCGHATRGAGCNKAIARAAPVARSDRPQFRCPRPVCQAAAQPMSRTEIPAPTANAVLFSADRTCCVCRVARKAIQIHHIDGAATNHDPANLAVLCLECHDDTMLTGGFGRRLNPGLIRLFRDDWSQRVADRRQAGGDHSRQALEGPPVESGPSVAASTDCRTEGESLLRRAAEAGSLDAASNLGAFLDRTGAAEEAERWLTTAAESGHLGAAVNLGVKHFEAGDDRGAAPMADHGGGARCRRSGIQPGRRTRTNGGSQLGSALVQAGRRVRRRSGGQQPRCYLPRSRIAG